MSDEPEFQVRYSTCELTVAFPPFAGVPGAHDAEAARRPAAGD